MKTYFLKTLVILSVTITHFAFGNSFEGVIKYSTTVTGAQAEAYKSMMPSGMTLYIKGDNYKTEVKSNNPMTSADIITLSKEEKTIVLIHSQKLYQVHKATDAEYKGDELKKTGKSKTINGYKCYEYVAVTKQAGQKMTSTVWTTEDLDIEFPKSNGMAQGMSTLSTQDMEGFPVLVEIKSDGFTMTMQLEDVEEKEISNSKFEIPSNYSEIKADNNQMQELMQRYMDE